jgi:UDP-N-acetylmuramate dehydrogenase
LLSIENEIQKMQVVFNNSMNADIDKTLFRGELREQEPMSRHTSWKTGGNAEYFYVAADIEDLSDFMSSLPNDMGVNWVGLGSNLLVRDGGLAGVVISVVGVLNELESIDENELKIGAGVTCAKAARFAAKQGLSGIEFLASIPGSIGGALAMNAGAYGGEMWRHVKNVETMNRKGERKIYTKDQFEIGYRSVSLADDEWFIACTLVLEISNKEDIEKNIKKMLSERAEAQPLGQHSCGSVFRNPENDHAARLIESCGLKGKQLGGAVVSEKHANFIINTGTATSLDIESLIELVQSTVYEKYEVQLIPEVRIIGERRSEQ